MSDKKEYPMQPIVNARFEANPIVNWLATEVSNMNDICLWCSDNDVPDKYQDQLAQLVGYSVSGYGSLSYVSDESYERAANQVHIQPLIPQTKEVEWVNGLPPVGGVVVLRYNHDSKTVTKTGVVKYASDKYCILDNGEGGEFSYNMCDYVYEKPESEADKLEREELEAAYDLYCHAIDLETPFDNFCNFGPLKDIYIKIVRKTEYRKQQ